MAAGVYPLKKSSAILPLVSLAPRSWLWHASKVLLDSFTVCAIDSLACVVCFSVESYEAANDNQRATTVATALENTFYRSRKPNAEGVELKIAMNGLEWTDLPLF